MIRVTIDRVVVEGLRLGEREVRDRLEAAFRAPRREVDVDEREVERIVREAFDA